LWLPAGEKMPESSGTSLAGFTMLLSPSTNFDTAFVGAPVFLALCRRRRIARL